jgi:hypothetical protein
MSDPPLIVTEFFDEPQVPPPRRRLFLVIALVVGIPLACVALLALAGLAYVAATRDVPVTDADRRMLLTADKIAPFMIGFAPHKKYESATKGQFMLDGSIELNYEYDDPSDAAPAIMCFVSLETSSKEAKATYFGYHIGSSIGNRLQSGVTLEERNEFFRWGDQSRSAVVMYEGQPAGHYFICRKGKNVFVVEFTGVTFAEDRETFAKMLRPCLEAMDDASK